MHKLRDLLDGLELANETVGASVSALSSVEVDPAGVAELAASVRSLQRGCAALVVGLAAHAKAHAASGSGPPVEVVLRDGLSVSDSTVRQDLDRARVAGLFPAVGQAIAAGAAFPENVDVLARITSRMTDTEVEELAAKHDERLAKSAGRLGTDSFRKGVQRKRDKIRDDNGRTAAEQAAAETYASVSVSRDNGTFRLGAVFDPLQGTAVQNALSAEFRRLTTDLGSGHDLSSDQISAQALCDLIVRGAATTPNEDNNRPGVVLHVHTDGQTLRSGPHANSMLETNDGVPLSPGVVGRLACDCVIRRVETLPDGRVNVSVSSRTATSAQKAALRALYDRCPISGASWSQMEVHHVHFVSHGGETILSNLIPISRRWHHLIHDEGWTLTMDSDRTLHLSRSEGTLFKTIAPPIPVLHKHALAA